MARDVKVVVRLAETVRDDLQELADSHGVSMSAYVAFLIGQHVHQSKTLLAPMMESVRAEFLRMAKVELPSEAALDAERSDG